MLSDNLPKPRVVLADDDQYVREVTAGVLNSRCEVELVGCACDGAQAVEVVLRLQPDILILDIGMPLLDGIRAARILRGMKSAAKIIFLTGIMDPTFQQAAMEVGANAYVFKTQVFTDLPRAIKAVTSEATFLST